jgi:hypothetical protein
MSYSIEVCRYAFSVSDRRGKLFWFNSSLRKLVYISYLKFRVFWDVAPCSHVEVDRRFRGAYCLHHRPDDGGNTHV